jgi:teichuronic acid biosynthesis glycosyltransferase TuaG
MSQKVSIILPFYNAQKTIKESIESVLDQEHENFELILVNDGSTDDSFAVVDQFKDNRIKYIFKSNAGVASARNLGIEHANGDYICFLDSDDLMTSNALTSRIRCFENDSNVSIVGGAQVQKDWNLEHVLHKQIPAFRGLPQNQLAILNDKCFINCGTWLIKRSIIADNKFPEGWTHSEDLAFFFLISEDAYLDFVTDVVQIYRRHADSAMSNLEGLELGYISYINLVRNHNVSIIPRIVLRLKSAKIMFLSFWAQNKKVRAIKSTFRLLVA